MKLAISNIAWTPDQTGVVADLLQDYNVTGIEVAPAQITPGELRPSLLDVKAYRQYWQDRGIEIVATQGVLFGHPELTLFETKEQRQKTLSYLKDMIEISAELGAKVVVFGSPKNRCIASVPEADQEPLALEVFRTLGAHAEEAGVFFCPEPNAPQYGTDFLNTTSETASFIAKVNHPGCQLHVDLSTMVLNHEDIEKSLTAAQPYWRHFHLSTPFLEPLGDAKLPHREVAETLHTLRYPNWLSIEMKNTGESTNIQQIENALTTVKNFYEIPA